MREAERVCKGGDGEGLRRSERAAGTDQAGYYLLGQATQDSKLDQIEQVNLDPGTALSREKRGKNERKLDFKYTCSYIERKTENA